MLQTRADFQSPEGNRIILTDFANKNQTAIYPANATYPHGLCQPRGFGGFVNSDPLSPATACPAVQTSAAARPAGLSLARFSCTQVTSGRLSCFLCAGFVDDDTDLLVSSADFLVRNCC